MKDFKNLDVWKNAYAFALEIYRITGKFPDNEKFGIVQQLRRAATSISANISEACGRSTDRDFLRFLYNAYGSIKECENFILLSRDLQYLSSKDFDELSAEIDKLSRMMNKLIEAVKFDIEGSRPRAQSPLL